MADLPYDPDTGVEPDRRSPIGTPRWVKVFGIIALVLVLLLGILLLTGIAGDHGPGRHLPTGRADDHRLPASVVNAQTPPGHHSGHPL